MDPERGGPRAKPWSGAQNQKRKSHKYFIKNALIFFDPNIRRCKLPKVLTWARTELRKISQQNLFNRLVHYVTLRFLFKFKCLKSKALLELEAKLQLWWQYRQSMAEKNWDEYVIFILVNNFNFDELILF